MYCNPGISRRDTLTALLTLAAAPAAFAQAAKPVRFLFSVSAGSGIDVITCAASRSLEVALGHPVIVENQPGAGGLIGTQALMKSAPDGFTLSMISANHVIAPAVMKNMSFNPVSDFTPIASVGATPLILTINPKLPVKNLAELVAPMRVKPDTINYGSSGNGSFLHLAAAAFLDAARQGAAHPSWTDKTLIACGRFYPPQAKTPEARLRHYATQFPLVEVDSSYCAMPSPAYAQGWGSARRRTSCST